MQSTLSRRLVSVIVVLSIFGAFHAAADSWPPASLLERPPFDLAAARAFAPSVPSIEITPLPSGAWKCRFRFESAADAKGVVVVGTFNNWNRQANPMQRAAAKPTASATPNNAAEWTAEFELPSGKHYYKFLVDADGWTDDPLNPMNEDDGHNGRNSVLKLGKLANNATSPAQRGDGKIDADGIAHDPTSFMYVQVVDDTHAQIRVRTLSNDIERASVVLKNGGTVPMHTLTRGPLLEYLEATVPTPGNAGAVEYAIVLEDGQTRALATPPQTLDRSKQARFVTPEWARDAIWYQIMPDRFRNGDPANDPPRVHPWKSDWFAMQPWESEDGKTFYKFAVFDRLYGGDIAGMQAKLGYLKSLGINAIYLNPVFEADSHHKYNATNYLHIDDDFGTRGDYEKAAAVENLNDPKTWTWTESDKLFLAFIQEAHKQGIRVVIDGVFNHVGTKHPAFQDVVKNGKKSQYADWFDVVSWEPFKHNGWAGHDALPVFKKKADGLASEQVKQHIFNVTRRWMDPNGDGNPNDGIDGWRLDVPNEIAPPFWAEWRTLVKSINPEAYITGEIWDRAEQWLDGRHFDAVMNYQFADPVIRWAMFDKLKLTAGELDATLAELRLAYPAAATYVLQNLVCSHDTDRIASMAHNPDRRYDQENRIQDNGPQYNNDKPSAIAYQRTRLVALVQMTYVGAPMIYYGDEVGMWGADDPTCRKPMLWTDLGPYDKPEQNAVSPETLKFYTDAISLRNKHSALRRGEFITLLTDDKRDLWCFARFDEREALIVALNASSSGHEIDLQLPAGWPGNWTLAFGDVKELESSAPNGVLKLAVPPISGVVYRAELSR